MAGNTAGKQTYDAKRGTSVVTSTTPTVVVSYAIPATTTILFKLKVVVRKALTTASDKYAIYQRYAIVTNVSATSALVVDINENQNIDAAIAGTTVIMRVTGNNLEVLFTGGVAAIDYSVMWELLPYVN